MRSKWVKECDGWFLKSSVHRWSCETHDGSDVWDKGWVINGQDHQCLRFQEGEGGIMIWAGIIIHGWSMEIAW